MPRVPVSTNLAPSAIGPYSQAIALPELVFVSGQTPLMPDGTLRVGGIDAQTEQCILNIREILRACGLTLDGVIKTTVFMTDLSRFSEMNQAYARFFTSPAPARSTVQVSALPKNAEIEIEAIAVRPTRP